jgi:hypothetical protein
LIDLIKKNIEWNFWQMMRRPGFERRVGNLLSQEKSQAEGFPQILQAPFSLMTPIQVPSLHNLRFEKSSSPVFFSMAASISVPHWLQ